jgi:Tol biopolymer transport system component
MTLRFLDNFIGFPNREKMRLWVLFSLTILLMAFSGCNGRVLQTDRENGIQTAESQQVVSATESDEFEEKNCKRIVERIVFSSNRSGPWRIWIMNADGSAMRQLTEGEPDDHDADPAFSPDAKTILFSSNRGGKIGVWKIPINSASSPERLCDGDQAQWSPDGTKIVFRRDEKIYIRDLASGREKIVSPIDWPHCSGPAWSPDSKTIAFACRWDAGNIIFTVEATGGEPTKVYDKQGACELQWSPDGQLLAYETETHICTIRPDGMKNRLITYFGGVQHYPRWSPDGKYLIYCQGMTEQGPWELYTIPSKGGTPVKLTEGGSDMNPDWK